MNLDDLMYWLETTDPLSYRVVSYPYLFCYDIFLPNIDKPVFHLKMTDMGSLSWLATSNFRECIYKDGKHTDRYQINNTRYLPGQ